MKVNMALLGEDAAEEKQAKPVKAKPVKIEPVQEPDEQDMDKEDDEEELDESDKHSKLKTVLLVALMLGGFAIFVSNMTGLVNNMRLDNQGGATTNIIYDAGDRLDNFMDIGEDGSITVNVEDHKESGVPTDAARDGPVSEDSGTDESDTYDGSVTVNLEDHKENGIPSGTYKSDSEAVAAMQKQVDEANNHAAFVEQELRNAEDMLDSSLQREAELQQTIDELTGN